MPDHFACDAAEAGAWGTGALAAPAGDNALPAIDSAEADLVAAAAVSRPETMLQAEW